MADQTTDTRPDYLVSGPPIDHDEVFDDGDGESSDQIEFKFETRAIFKRLADDIYKSTQAGIREPLSNSITAVLQAEERYGIDNPQVEITVEGSEQPRVTLRDNGIGITEEILNDVLSYIGRSMNRDSGDVSGKYGMGFLACYKLVGIDGGFVMHTRSRKTDDSFTGLWTANGFDQSIEDKYDNPFAESDTYGTQLEFLTKEGITRNDIRKWVRDLSQLARVPVIYREFDEDGKERFNEDYGDLTLKDVYGDDEVVLSVENEHFEAYCCPSAESRTLLLDMPIQRNYNLRTDLPWSVDVRLKNENGVIYEGPNKGKEPVTDGEYDDLPEAKKDEAIRESNVSVDDKTIPSPIGTRDSLSSHSNFWDDVKQKLTAQYLDVVASIIEDAGVSDSIDPLMDTQAEKLELIVKTFENQIVKSSSKFKKEMNQRMSTSQLTDETAKSIYNLQNKVAVVDWAEYNFTSSLGYSAKERKSLWKVLIDVNDGDVFMACKINKQKAKVVRKDNDNNKLVKVSSSDKYEEYGEKFGWRRLRDIKSSTIDEFDIPESLRKKFKNSGGSSANSDLTLYYVDNQSRDSSKSVDIENLSKYVEGDSAFDLLVVFPRSDDRNVSDTKWLANTRVAVCSCTTSQWELLEGRENIIRASDYFQQAREMPLVTSDGIKRADELSWDTDDTVLHIVRNNVANLFKDEQIVSEMPDVMQETFTRYDGTPYFDETITYVPLSVEEADRLRPMFYTENGRNVQVIQGDISYGSRGLKASSDTKLYAYARLNDWKSNDVLEFFDSITKSLDQSSLQLVEMLGELHDGMNPDEVTF